MKRSTVQNGSISRDSLILNLDASNAGSYPGTGNIWFDISGYGNHFNLQGIVRPVFNVNKLDFNYAGGNQYATCQNTTFGNMGTGSYTLEYVYYYTNPIPANATLASIIRKRSGAATIASGQLNLGNPPVLPAPNWSFIDGYWRYTGSINNGSPGFSHNVGGGWTSAIDEAGLRNIGAAYLSAAPSPLTLAHVVHVFRRGFPDFREVTASVYINNAATATTNYHLSGSGIVSNNLATTLMLAENFRTGSLYYVRAYNRELSRTEITQNYTLARSKYGL